jgi:DNA-binding ferritin-like protein (Dps family)
MQLQSEGTESDEGDEDIEEIEHLFELAEKDVDEFCDNFVGEEENWNSVFTFTRA